MKKRVITFHYTLKDPKGEVIDSSSGHEPLGFLEGASQIIPGLEKEVIKLKKGDKKIIKVPADEAYGKRDDRFVITVGRKELPPGDIQVGQQFELKSDQGAHVVLVTKITDTEVVLDGNHPLAGVDLAFDIEVTDMREATEEELSHGHSHGGDGHHH